MTAAETLRAAAYKLRDTYRELAKVEDIRGPFPMDLWTEIFSPEDRVNLPETNAWIRLVNPGLAEPLAAWLEGTAVAVEGGAIVPHSVLCAYALAVARAVLGQEAETACWTAYDGDTPVGPYHQLTEADAPAAVAQRGYTIRRWHCPLHDGRQPADSGERL